MYIAVRAYSKLTNAISQKYGCNGMSGRGRDEIEEWHNQQTQLELNNCKHGVCACALDKMHCTMHIQIRPVQFVANIYLV